MKLGETERTGIVTMLWIASAAMMAGAISVFLFNDISWLMTKLLIVSAGLGFAARFFMKENKQNR